LGDQGTETVLLDARRSNVTDANLLLEHTDIYVEYRETFVTINEPEDGAKRMTDAVNIFGLFF